MRRTWGNWESKMTCIVKIEEDFDANAVEAMRGALERLADVAGDLEIDMTRARFIDASGIGTIIFLYRRARAQGCNLAVTGLSGQPLTMMQRLGLAELVAAQPQQAA